jgi:hypothetical protein
MALLGLNPNATPELFEGADGKPFPVEPVAPGGRDRTAWLNIDLQMWNKTKQPKVSMPPMTAVFAPDPAALSGDVDVILWFHGDKSYWESKPTEETKKKGKTSWGFQGETIQYYLTKLPMCRLREFILQTKKKNFILVAPTLNNKTGVTGDHGLPGGLVWDQADAEAYLQQAVNAVKTYMKASVSGVGNIVIAGHSGGGHLQSQMAQYFSGKFDKANEVWCFDSTYWGSKPFITWVNKGHAHPRLWVYSTGGTTGYNAHTLMDLTTHPMDYAKVTARAVKPKPARTKEERAQAKAAAFVGTALNKFGAVLDTRAHLAAIANTQIDILIESDPNTGKTSVTDTFFATYGGKAGGHYEGMPKYLPALVQSSRNLN